VLLALAVSLMALVEVAAPSEYSRVWEPLTDAQRVAVQCIEPEVCYSGRRFGAKSNTGCAKSYLYPAIYNDPPAYVLLAREERASMNATTVKTLRDEIVPPAQWVAGWHESRSDLVLRNGSVIHVRGLDDPGRVLGLRVGLAVIDQAEQVSLEQFEIANSCVMQIGMPFHQTLGLFNPEGPDHWAFERYDPDAGDGLRHHAATGKVFARVVHVQPGDLLHLLSQESRERFDRMDGVLGQRLRWGKWVAAEGAVFDNWDAGVHVIDRARPPEWAAADMATWAKWGGYAPPDWQRRRGIDFGYEHPYWCGWIAESPEGRRYLYRQDMRTHLTIDEQAERILGAERDELAALRASACEQGEGMVRGMAAYLESYPLAGSWSDHDRQEREMFAVRGVATAAAEKDIRAGIETIRELLDHREGAPRLCVLADSLMEVDQRLREARKPTSLQAAMPRYRWQTVREKSDSQNVRDLPWKRDDDAIDGLRYMEHSNACGERVGIWT